METWKMEKKNVYVSAFDRLFYKKGLTNKDIKIFQGSESQ